MSVEENKVIFRRHVEEVGNEGNLDLVDEILIVTSPISPTVTQRSVAPRTSNAYR